MRPEPRNPEDAARLRDFYRALDVDIYPVTVAAADDLTGVPLDDEFRFGLRLVLDGIEHLQEGRRLASG